MKVSANMEQFLPDNVAGWINKEPDNNYNPSNLYNYINGGAELFISYGFTNAVSRQFVS